VAGRHATSSSSSSSSAAGGDHDALAITDDLGVCAVLPVTPAVRHRSPGAGHRHPIITKRPPCATSKTKLWKEAPVTTPRVVQKLKKTQKTQTQRTSKMGCECSVTLGKQILKLVKNVQNPTKINLQTTTLVIEFTPPNFDSCQLLFFSRKCNNKYRVLKKMREPKIIIRLTFTLKRSRVCFCRCKNPQYSNTFRTGGGDFQKKS
jgi:hypothetical protein